MSDPTAALEREQSLARILALRSIASHAWRQYVRTNSAYAHALYGDSQAEMSRLEARVQEL